MADSKREEDVYELEEVEHSSPVREGSDRRTINFYKLYSDEELRKVPEDRRKGDRRQEGEAQSGQEGASVQ